MKYLVLPLTLALVLALVACARQPQKPKKTVPTMKAQPTAPKESLIAKPESTAKPSARPEFTQAPPLVKFKGTPYITIKVKDFGTVKIQLDARAAPQNVSNVYQLAKAGFYDGTIFHRVIKGFMIQGGDPTGTGRGGPAYTVPAEIKLSNVRGAVAMARQGDQANPTKASSSCQFYICHGDATFLDKAGYTVIGKVVEGMDVVDKIANAQTQPGGDGQMSSPVTPVIMEKVTVEEK